MTELAAMAPAPVAPDSAVDYPLTWPQEQLWFIDRLQPGGNQYNELWLFYLDGPVELERLQAALTGVVNRHPALRSTFHEVDGRARVRLLPQVTLDLARPVDVSHLPPADREQFVTRYAGQLADEPYDLARGPLLRTSLLRLDERRHALLVGLHHLVADGWSADILVRELDAWYRGGESSLPPLPTSYLDYARQQREQGTPADQLGYWRDQLRGADPVLDLTGPGLRPPFRRGCGERVPFRLDAELMAAIDRFARATGLTRAGVLMAGVAVVLHRYTGRRDLILGSASEARPSRELESVIGFFATLLPLRLSLDPDASFRTTAAEVTERGLDALDHQDVAFPHLVELVETGRDPSYPPLLQVVFNHAAEPAGVSRIGPLRVEQVEVPRGRARFDLLIEAYTGPDRGTLWMEYDTDLFDAGWVRRFVDHLRRALTSGLADPDRPVAELAVLTPAERQRWSGEPSPLPAADPPGELVLVDGDLLAPTGVIGEVHLVHRSLCTITGDRVTAREGRAGCRPTGQLGCWEEQDLVVLGPADRLPAIGGIRVPLDQIRAALAVHPGVRSARVWLAEGRPVAEVVAAEGGGVDRVELLTHLRARLPRYAVPELVGVTDAGGGDVHAGLLAIWRKVLAAPLLGPHDDFFAAGGHSLLAVELVDAIDEGLGIRLPVRRVFQHPTVAELATVLAAELAAGTAELAAGTGEPAASPGAPVVAGEPSPRRGTPLTTDGAPLTAAQADIWVVQRLAPGTPVYNVPLAVDLDGDLDQAALASAVDSVVARHDVLQCTFAFDHRRVTHRPAAEPPRLAVVDLRALPPAAGQAEADRAEQAEARRPFDLASDPPLRVTLLRLPEGRARLLITAHHIAVDGIALGVICQELTAGYAAARAGSRPELPPLPLTWGQYAGWEGEWLEREEKQLARYWRELLADVPPLQLPTQRARPSSLTFDGAHLERAVPALAEAVDATARRLRATPAAVSTAAVAALLHRRSGQPVVTVATPADNRRLPGARALVGCCISMLVLPVRCAPGMPFGELVTEVRDLTLDAYQHQGLPLPAMIRAAGSRRDRNRMALFQVASDWQRDPPLAFAGCRAQVRYVSTGTARNDLSFTTTRGRDGLRLAVEYNTNLWQADGAGELLDELVEILTAGVAGPR